MCISSGGGNDQSGNLAQQAANTAHDRVVSANIGIDNAFSGFDQPYYDKYTNDYKAANVPQEDQQYANARKNTQLALASSGNLSSSYGAQTMADLQGQQQNNLNQIGASAIDATNAQRTTIQNNKSALHSLANTSANPSQAAGQAPVIASGLDTPVPVSPIGDMFSTFTNLAGNAAAAERAGYYGTGTGLFGPPQSVANQPSNIGSSYIKA